LEKDQVQAVESYSLALHFHIVLGSSAMSYSPSDWPQILPKISSLMLRMFVNIYTFEIIVSSSICKRPFRLTGRGFAGAGTTTAGNGSNNKS
jgi:hypothetical protein